MVLRPAKCKVANKTADDIKDDVTGCICTTGRG
jgi:hypothetical protein